MNKENLILLQSISYDAEGNCNLRTEYSHDGTKGVEITGEYNNENQLLVENWIYPNEEMNHQVKYRYDTNGNNVAIITHYSEDMIEEEYFEYDEAGRLLEKGFVIHKGGKSSKRIPNIQYEYDSAGKEISSLWFYDSQIKIKTTSEYFENGLLAKSIEHELRKKTWRKSSETSYEYDDDGHCIKEFSLNDDSETSSTVLYKYDKFGRCIEIIDSKIRSVTEYSDTGNPIVELSYSSTVGKNGIDQEWSLNKKTVYEYNSAGQKIAVYEEDLNPK